jgi:hypothetical protein
MDASSIAWMTDRSQRARRAVRRSRAADPTMREREIEVKQ